MDYKEMSERVKIGAAIRYQVQLQPAGGRGDKVFPATYKDVKYAEEYRMINGEQLFCIHLDSVQSQANRMEGALLSAMRRGDVSIPVIQVDFPSADPDLTDVGIITSLDAPHRIADAILRDSEKNGVRFRETDEGKVLDYVSRENATDLFEIAPTSLLFGVWDSTGPKGGLGVKFQRSIVSEIVAINAIKGVRTSSRIDPLGIQKDAGPVYLVGKTKGEWTLESSDKNGRKLEKAGKDGSPSEVNHGNIPPTVDDPNGGITFDHAKQLSIISLPSLRRLHFPLNGKVADDVDLAAQTVLCCLGLVALSSMNREGYDLRSRCLLVPEEAGSWTFLDGNGKEEQLSIPYETAVKLLNEAVAQAESKGLKWRSEPICLVPSKGLIQLVKKSRVLMKEKGE